MREYAVALSLGHRRDSTATLVLKDSPQLEPGGMLQSAKIRHLYDIVYIAREQGMLHTVVERIFELMQRAALAENADLLVDGTGLGEGVVDLLREKGLRPIPIISTSAGLAREVWEQPPEIFPGVPRLKIRALKEIHVPRADLVAAGQLIVQQQRLRIAAGLKWAGEAESQFKAFRGKINERTKHKVYEADTEEAQNDLVICFLLAAWWMTAHQKQDEILPQSEGSYSHFRFLEEEPADWDPWDWGLERS